MKNTGNGLVTRICRDRKRLSGLWRKGFMRMIGLSKQINDYRGSMTDSEVVDCQSQARDARISWALMSPFVVLAWQYLLLASFSLFGTSVGSAIQMLSKLMVGAVYIWALPSVTKKHTKLLIISYWGTLTIFLFHFLILFLVV